MNFLKTTALVVAALGGLTLPAQAETVWRYSNWLPSGHVILTDAIDPWIADVERVTEGRVRIETLPKTVGTVAGQYDVAVDGLADVVFMIQGYTPGRFPLSEIVERPFIGSDPEAASAAFWRIYQSDIEPLNEYRGVHVLSVFTASPANIATTNKQVTKVSDLEGLKMRNPLASFIPAVEALGAVPVNKPISEIYELATSGVVDGGFIPLDSMQSFKLYDALPYTTIVEGGLFTPALGFLVNQDSWMALSEADRAAIMEVSGEHFARKVGAGYARTDEAALAEINRRDDTQAIEADEAMMNELRERLAFMDEAWIEKAKAAGMKDPAAVLEKLRAEVDKIQTQ